MAAGNRQFGGSPRKHPAGIRCRCACVERGSRDDHDRYPRGGCNDADIHE